MGAIKGRRVQSLFLAASVALNLILWLRPYPCGGGEPRRHERRLSWSTRAAEEAEAVAAEPCSGHGLAFVDGSVVDGRPVCECYACFGGSDCSEIRPGCVADADSGNPLFLEPFWRRHAAGSAVVVAGWHRMGYSFGDDSAFSRELEDHVRRVHAAVGNAVTAGRFIVFGTGSTQLLNAAVSALSAANRSSSPTRVVASIPFYPVYEAQTDLFRSVDFEFKGDALMWKNRSGGASGGDGEFVEFVTAPNNPDGELKKAVLEGPNAKTIHDRAYYWPHFTAIPAPADDDLMIFTISKLTGHAGSRFGWAVIKDEGVYQRMLKYLKLNTIGVSKETQLRALKLLKVILEGGRGKEIFGFGFETMSSRWEKLSNILSASKRFSAQKIAPAYCNYFQRIRQPSPAYAWVKCEKEEETDCAAVLKDGGIIGRNGSLFHAGSRFVRLSLLKSEDDLDLLLQKLKDLVSQEDGGRKTM